MITTVGQNNEITIPAEIVQRFGIKPGYRLDWRPADSETVIVRFIPDRAELARRIMGEGRRFSPERDSVAELLAERSREG